MAAANQSNKAGFVSNLMVLSLLGITVLASAGIWLLGDWQNHGWWLTLTLRILWGCWAVAVLATVLTRVTIFGWTFRRYFRWDGQGTPPQVWPRPTRAPWTKSAAASFSFTVSMVAVTGVTGLALAVMWILKPLTGETAFQVILIILGSVWWIAIITLVLVRVAIFGMQKHQAEQAARLAAEQHARTRPEPVNATSENGR